MKGKWMLLMALGMLVLGTMACDSGGVLEATEVSPEESSNNVVIKDVHLYRDNGSGEPGDEVTSFKPSDRILHFEIDADNLPSGETVKWVFIAVDTSSGQNITITEIETDELLAGNQIFAQLSLPNDWPTGTYRADVYVGTEHIYTLDYSIEDFYISPDA